MSEWIPVTKELPDDDRSVLVTISGFWEPCIANYIEEHGEFLWVGEDDLEISKNKVSAWMELPEPYKEKEQ